MIMGDWKRRLQTNRLSRSFLCFDSFRWLLIRKNPRKRVPPMRILRIQADGFAKDFRRFGILVFPAVSVSKRNPRLHEIWRGGNRALGKLIGTLQVKRL